MILDILTVLFFVSGLVLVLLMIAERRRAVIRRPYVNSRMINLALRSIGSNDYAVIDDGHPVGRIRLASQQRAEVWYWSVTIPVPGAPNGSAASLKEAKAAFVRAWTKSKIEIGPERFAKALEIAEAARERLKAKENEQ